MNITLSTNEKIIKKYDYSASSVKATKGGSVNTTSTLYVTNKRIISEFNMDKKGVARKEIPLAAADYVQTLITNSAKYLILLILLAILSVIFLIAGTAGEESTPLIIGVVLLVLTIVLLIMYLLSRKTSVYVEISGKMNEYPLMEICASTSVLSNSKIKKIKIKVDKQTAETMVDEIGAIIIDAKSGINL